MTLNSKKNKIICDCCQKYLIIPNDRVNNFLIYHLNLKKKSKYLILIFRLCPYLFSYDIMILNKYLREIFFNWIGYTRSSNLELSMYLENKEMQNIYLNYQTKELTSFVYELYFHQQNIEYIDHVKCSICNFHLCPLHLYLANCDYSKCTYCEKKWIICGWCKPIFQESAACKFVHQTYD